jgi:putative Holliday junction resolvase
MAKNAETPGTLDKRRVWKIKPFTRVKEDGRRQERLARRKVLERVRDDFGDIDEKEERILALDLGTRRCGLAISDPLGIIASGLGTLEPEDAEELLRRLGKIVRDKEVTLLVVGHPIMLSGERGERAIETERFAEEAQRRLQIPVELYDERLTSVAAERALHEMDIKPSRAKKKVDEISAVLLLQSYLDRRAREEE